MIGCHQVEAHQVEPAMGPKWCSITNYKKMATPARKCRSWLCVVNNYTDDDINRLLTILRDDGCKSGIIAREEGAEGTPHLQCFFTFVGCKRLAGMKKLHATAHWEDSQRSAGDHLYEKKDDDIIEEKKPEKKQGKRKDLEDMREMVKRGCSERDIYDSMPHMLAMSNAVSKAFDIYGEQNLTALPTRRYVDFDWPESQTLFLFGRTGTGKTEWAIQHFKRPLLVRHKDQLRKLQGGGYDGIIFDDFDVKHWPRTAVIHLFDLSRPSGIDVKHGHVVIPAGLPRVVTSNFTYDKVTPEDDSGAIERRLYLLNIETLDKVTPDE